MRWSLGLLWIAWLLMASCPAGGTSEALTPGVGANQPRQQTDVPHIDLLPTQTWKTGLPRFAD